MKAGLYLRVHALMMLVAENGFSEDEVESMVEQLKQRGLVQFLVDYLKPGADGSIPSLRRLLLSLGIIPVGLGLSEESVTDARGSLLRCGTRRCLTWTSCRSRERTCTNRIRVG